MMNPTRNLGTRVAVATGVATAFLASVCLEIQPAQARPQDPAVTIKVNVQQQVVTEKGEVQKVQVQKVVTDKVEAPKVEAPKAEAKQVEAGVVKARKAAAVVQPPAPIAADAVMVEFDGVINGQPANLVVQFTNQYHSILQGELWLLTSACQPSPEQRREIAMAGGKALKQAATRMAQVQMGMNQGRAGVMPDPRKMARDAMETVAKEKLSEPQFAAYKKEIAASRDHLRNAEVLHLVATLDRLLILSKDQREKLHEALRTHWDERNYPTLDTATMYEGYYPTIPSAYLNPILDADQMKIWAAATKISYGSIRNFNAQTVAANPPEGEDPDIKAAFAEEPKKPVDPPKNEEADAKPALKEPRK